MLLHDHLIVGLYSFFVHTCQLYSQRPIIGPIIVSVTWFELRPGGSGFLEGVLALNGHVCGIFPISDNANNGILGPKGRGSKPPNCPWIRTYRPCIRVVGLQQQHMRNRKGLDYASIVLWIVTRWRKCQSPYARHNLQPAEWFHPAPEDRVGPFSLNPARELHCTRNYSRARDGSIQSALHLSLFLQLPKPHACSHSRA